MLVSRTRRNYATALLTFLALAGLACGAAIADPSDGDQVASQSATTTSQPPSGATASPTPAVTDTRSPIFALDAAGIPTSAVGPLIVYRSLIPDDLSFGLGSPSSEVVVYDLGTGAELNRIWIGNPGRQPQASVLVAQYIVVNLGNEVWRYALDGSRTLLFDAPVGIIVSGIAGANDAGAVVIATQTQLDSPVTLIWIDVESTAVLRETASVALEGAGIPLPRLVGEPAEPTLLRGVTYSSQPGAYAVLETDDSLRELSTTGFGTPAPDGRHVAHGPAAVCETIGGTTIEITNVATNQIVATFAATEASLVPWDWSPDGTELAFLSRPLRPDGVCPNVQIAPDWFVISLDGRVREVASGLDLRLEWYGERAVTFRCSSLIDAGWFSRRDGLQRPSDCLRFDVEISVGGRPIATEPTATILGFIEVE